MQVTNLTPHAITVRLADGSEKTFPPSGQLARVETTDETVASFEGVLAVRRVFGAVVLKAPMGDDPLIVSALVLEAAKTSDHPALYRMICPDTGSTAIRENGQVKAVTRWVVA